MRKDISTSISTFKNIRKADFLYVDKTEYIYEMVRKPFGQYFFSRPRRFGKSLTVSTLEAIFSGDRDAFDGLYIAKSDYDWEVYPTIHIDFGRSDSSTKTSLEKWLNYELRQIAGEYDVAITGSTPALLFGDLIKSLYAKYSKGVVILIDEYDKPITNNIEDGKQLKNIRILMEAFYQIIKGYEAMERFVFLTGITKLSQISIFSKLNNLEDISRNKKYAGLVGYTQEELDQYFREYLADAARHHNCSIDEIREKLAYWYDGFRFTFADVTVYNPVSIGCFFNENYEFRNYWFATATPVMLVNQAKKQQLSVENIRDAIFTDLSYSTFDISALAENKTNVQLLIQLLFQTGYLTFGDKIDNPLTETYHLVYPNYEVQMSFEMELTAIYAGQGVQEINNIVVSIQNAAITGNAEKMISLFKALFAGVPYGIQLKYEKYYQSMMFLFFKMCGMDVEAEEQTNVGRIDASLIAGDYIYVIECKIDKDAASAIDQINRKRYIEKYGVYNDKTIIKIGINFSTEKDVRNISDYHIETVG